MLAVLYGGHYRDSAFWGVSDGLAVKKRERISSKITERAFAANARGPYWVEQLCQTISYDENSISIIEAYKIDIVPQP
jgi:hypothetical protein